MKSPTQHLLNDVERYLRKTRMMPTKFGILAVGDPNLVHDLRRGRELRHATHLRVRRAMSRRRMIAVGDGYVRPSP